MSGFSDITICPNCGNEAESYTDYKPFDYSTITCIHCGLVIYPKVDYMNLRELNEMRKERDYAPLKRRPNQSKNII